MGLLFIGKYLNVALFPFDSVHFGSRFLTNVVEREDAISCLENVLYSAVTADIRFVFWANEIMVILGS
jgi:hypothetical protein